ncbi:Myb-like_DNA-binding domain-containing protein [Hexamita inflata]|uniref:Myb-like DNA-binding domain-containing protein n=1 Tax=Hexamita inflata TaxID=28002 RepID=A0AA86RN68_9EUKA|nr:Myb-like DNA-binding domain-containing protein [Hexamita inflata]
MPQWSQDDIDLLLKIIEQNRQQKRINWKNVAKQFPGRTLGQCKSYYTAKLMTNSDKVNTYWDYDANLLLAAFADTYGTRWQFLSENCYQNKITADALRKQFNTVQKIDKGMAEFTQSVLTVGINKLNQKAFTMYILYLSLDFRLRQTYIKMEQATKPKENISDAQLPKVFDAIPMLKRDIYAETADQLIFQPFYKKMEIRLQIHEYISIVEAVIAQTSPEDFKKISNELDAKRKEMHKFFL